MFLLSFLLSFTSHFWSKINKREVDTVKIFGVYFQKNLKQNRIPGSTLSNYGSLKQAGTIFVVSLLRKCA